MSQVCEGAYTETRDCPICKLKFNANGMASWQICLACQRKAVEDSKIPYKLVRK